MSNLATFFDVRNRDGRFNISDAKIIFQAYRYSSFTSITEVYLLHRRYQPAHLTSVVTTIYQPFQRSEIVTEQSHNSFKTR